MWMNLLAGGLSGFLQFGEKQRKAERDQALQDRNNAIIDWKTHRNQEILQKNKIEVDKAATAKFAQIEKNSLLASAQITVHAAASNVRGLSVSDRKNLVLANEQSAQSLSAKDAYNKREQIDLQSENEAINASLSKDKTIIDKPSLFGEILGGAGGAILSGIS